MYQSNIISFIFRFVASFFCSLFFNFCCVIVLLSFVGSQTSRWKSYLTYLWSFSLWCSEYLSTRVLLILLFFFNWVFIQNTSLTFKSQFFFLWRFERGKAEAFEALCQIFTSKSDTDFLPEYLAAFYRGLEMVQHFNC